MRPTLWVEKTFLWKALIWFQKAVLIIMGASSAMLVTVNVLGRYLFHVDVFAIEELVTIATVWMYFIGASYASYEENHIVADLIGPMMKKPLSKKLLKIFVGLCNFLVLGFFLKWTYRWIVWSWKIWPKTTGLHIPLMCSQIAILVGMVLMAIYAVFHFVLIFKDNEKVSPPDVENTNEGVDGK